MWKVEEGESEFNDNNDDSLFLGLEYDGGNSATEPYYIIYWRDGVCKRERARASHSTKNK